MISRHIMCKPKNDNFKRLANYIVDASHDGEKSLLSWCEGCYSGDDYEFAVQEILDTQDMNTRSQKEKTYHLMISVRPEDESNLTPDVFKEIEKQFADVLGFKEHQRICGVHKNTNNIHIHIAYNMINKEKYTRLEPFQDYPKRNKLCRQLEQELGLTIDVKSGQEIPNEQKMGSMARTFETRTGLQSFETYAKEQKETILNELKTATNWQDVHSILSKIGMEITPHGNGLVFKDLDGKQSVKASAVDRSLSIKKLQDRFGKFEAKIIKHSEHKSEIPNKKYKSKPIQKDAKSSKLWAEFMEHNQVIKSGQKDAIEVIKNKWIIKQEDMSKQVFNKKTKSGLSELLRNYRDKEINKIYMEQKHKAKNWLDFLREKAQIGDEEALAVLRSRKQKAEPEKDIHKDTDKYIMKGKYLEKREKILESNLQHTSKRKLLDVALLEYITQKECKYDISSCGAVIFKVEDGAKIYDDGKQICFPDGAKELALKFARAKWGLWNLDHKKMEKLIDNNALSREKVMAFEKNIKVERVKKREQGQGRSR